MRFLKHFKFISSTLLQELRATGVHPLTLSFPEPLEKTFSETYFQKSREHVHNSLVIAIVFFGLFGILDAILAPTIKNSLWLIRYGLICPALIVLLVFSFTAHFKQYMHAAIASCMIVTGYGIIWMIVISPPPVNYSYYAGLILVFMYGYSFMRMRFVWATFAGWVIVVLYEIAAGWLSNTPLPVLINNNFFFISANIIGMFACYSIEYFARRDYHMALMLKKEQEKVKTINQELEKRVRQRTIELIKANEDLKQEMTERKRAEKELIRVHKMEAIGTLAGGIAHDFNNILTAIIGYSEIGLYNHTKNVDKVKYSFEQILNAGNRAKDLVKQILTFSRQQEQAESPVKVGLIVKETLKLMRATLPKHIEIQYKSKATSDTVMADPTQIHQIIMNLCTNASHALKEQGGKIEVSLINVTLTGGTVDKQANLAPGEYLELRVADTGTGMSPAVVDRIFDPFFTTKKVGEGTGMGLSVVHGIVKNHNGSIHIESEVGKGSTFYVYLPLIVNEVTEEPKKNQQMPSGSERILFVDDEAAITEYGETILTMLGYKVVASTSSLQAFEYFREQPEQFDLVITDLAMPKMTGAELSRQLKSIRADIPIILCTGYGESITYDTISDMGIQELFMKPIMMHEMAATIRRVLDKVH